MFDARRIPNGTSVDADICIIGAGAAGITIAREFVDTQFRVCVVEGGDLHFDPETQDLYTGENVGRHYYDLDVCRLRFFGGTTNHWGGWCRPLDPIDFEVRDWIPYSGWPFRRKELEPFYARAWKICGVDPSSALNSTKRSATFPLDRSRIVTRFVKFSPPTRFGEIYRQSLSDAKNISIYLNANAVELVAKDPPTLVDHLLVSTLAGNQLRVAARVFVLAAGGIENARLLLVSNRRAKAGLGNERDLVGRFFMDHPEPEIGLFVPTEREASKLATYAWNMRGRERLKPLGVLSLAVKLQEQEGILNSDVGLARASPPEGWAALRRLLDRVAGRQSREDLGQDLQRIISDLQGVVGTAYSRLSGADGSDAMFRMISYGQQAPNPDSRITLSDELDALGLPRVRLDWQLSEVDRISIRRTLQIFAEEFGRSEVGRVNLDFVDWPDPFYYGNHHIGTTRMSHGPSAGVVDRSCRLHNVGNLYVSGSSTFPTSGTAPPTLTIVALAVRLADHLKVTV